MVLKCLFLTPRINFGGYGNMGLAQEIKEWINATKNPVVLADFARAVHFATGKYSSLHFYNMRNLGIVTNGYISNVWYLYRKDPYFVMVNGYVVSKTYQEVIKEVHYHANGLAKLATEHRKHIKFPRSLRLFLNNHIKKQGKKED